MKDNLYILKVTNSDGKSLIKLGYSSDIKIRLDSYYSHNPFTEIIGTYYREDACAFEKWFHKNNISIYRNEWYCESFLEKILNDIYNEHSYDYLKYSKLNEFEEFKGFKKCYKCFEIKSISEFNKDVTKLDNLSGDCRSCKSIRNKKYRNKNK